MSSPLKLSHSFLINTPVISGVFNQTGRPNLYKTADRSQQHHCIIVGKTGINNSSVLFYVWNADSSWTSEPDFYIHFMFLILCTLSNATSSCSNKSRENVLSRYLCWRLSASAATSSTCRSLNTTTHTSVHRARTAVQVQDDVTAQWLTCPSSCRWDTQVCRSCETSMLQDVSRSCRNKTSELWDAGRRSVSPGQTVRQVMWRWQTECHQQTSVATDQMKYSVYHLKGTAVVLFNDTQPDGQTEKHRDVIKVNSRGTHLEYTPISLDIKTTDS